MPSRRSPSQRTVEGRQGRQMAALSIGANAGRMISASRRLTTGSSTPSPAPPAAGAPPIFSRDRFALSFGGAQTKALSYTPAANSLHAYLNGVYQDEGTDYTISGSSLLVQAAMGAAAGDVLECRYAFGAAADPGLTGYPAAVVADGPALYWRLGEPSGSVAADSSGFARHGTYGGTPTYGTAGLCGDSDTCITCSGDDYVEIAYASWMDTSTVTVEAIVKTSSTGSGRLIVDRDDDPSTPRVFQFRKSSTEKLQFIIIGTSIVTATGSTSISDGNPHHVAATYDGATIKLYLDGVLDGSASTSVPLPTSASPLRAGVNHSAGYNAHWIGQLDEVAYYKSALSAARIAAHATAAGL